MKLWKFAKPKGPGYGISADFYLSVLAAKAQLPPLLAVLNPKAEADAVQGMGAPLASGAAKEDLAKPLARGVYALASIDRKTVLRLRVLSKEEAGFDPEPVARSALGAAMPAELLARIRATWSVLQLTFESHDPTVAPAIAFAHAIARRMAELTDGCVADPVSERYRMPGDLGPIPAAGGGLPAQEIVSVRATQSDGGLHAFTLGMRKLAMPEFELSGLEPGSELLAEAFLLGVCQRVLNGKPVRPGDQLGSRRAPFQVAQGGLDRAMWEGIACWELIPPTGRSAADSLREWASEND